MPQRILDATKQSAQSLAGSSDLFGPLSETLPFASRRRVATLRSLSATSVEGWAITRPATRPLTP